MLARVGSVTADVTVAVLVMLPADEGANTVTVTDEFAPFARLGLVHVTIPDACEQVHPIPVAL